MHYRGRFAPSPTGPLHAGSLSTALFSYLHARACKGQWLLRIDDLDPERTRPQYIDEIMFALDAHGLHWDESVRFQSKNFEAYREAIRRLSDKHLIYCCNCSRSQRQHRGDAKRYDGYCANLHHPVSSDMAARIRTSNASSIHWTDLLQGPQSVSVFESYGDAIVWRRDQIPAYSLATVIDDECMDVNHVIRGADLLCETALQLFIQKRLAFAPVTHGHLPVITDTAGNKLSKQTGAAALDSRIPQKNLCMILELFGLHVPPDVCDDVNILLDWAVCAWGRLDMFNKPSIELSVTRNRHFIQ